MMTEERELLANLTKQMRTLGESNAARNGAEREKLLAEAAAIPMHLEHDAKRLAIEHGRALDASTAHERIFLEAFRFIGTHCNGMDQAQIATNTASLATRLIAAFDGLCDAIGYGSTPPRSASKSAAANEVR